LNQIHELQKRDEESHGPKSWDSVDRCLRI
jgi:hypothetical protein